VLAGFYACGTSKSNWREKGDFVRAKRTKLVREQLGAKLKRFEPLRDAIPPRKGWIRAIRDALGMTGGQLAKRLGVNKQRVARIERDEAEGNVTVKTMRRVAEALDCVFVYGFVPRTSLEQTVRDRAAQVAKGRMDRVSQTMRLEQQELDDSEKQMALGDATERLTDTTPKTLWDDE
jgi:predicted DNA-binding mobile mystery protein A